MFRTNPTLYTVTGEDDRTIEDRFKRYAETRKFDKKWEQAKKGSKK